MSQPGQPEHRIRLQFLIHQTAVRQTEPDLVGVQANILQGVRIKRLRVDDVFRALSRDGFRLFYGLFTANLAPIYRLLYG